MRIRLIVILAVTVLAAAGGRPRCRARSTWPIAARRPMRPSTPSPPTAWPSSRAPTSSSRISPSPATACSSACTIRRSSAPPTSKRASPTRHRGGRRRQAAPGVARQRLHAGRDQDPRRRLVVRRRSSPASGSRPSTKRSALIRGKAGLYPELKTPEIYQGRDVDFVALVETRPRPAAPARAVRRRQDAGDPADLRRVDGAGAGRTTDRRAGGAARRRAAASWDSRATGRRRGRARSPASARPRRSSGRTPNW